MFQDLTFDLRFALRSLAKRPLLSAVIVLVLCLGIGSATTMFTLYESVVLSPVAYPEPDSLTYGYGANSSGNTVSISPLDFLDTRRAVTQFEEYAAVHGFSSSVDLTGRGEPVQLAARGISHNFFDALRVPMQLGREFLPEEESETATVVVLSHSLWAERTGADPNIVGQPLTIDGESATVIGVLPSGFRWLGPADLWYPIAFDAERAQVRRFHFLRAVGRLAEGVSLESARAELDGISAELEATYPDTNTGWYVNLVPFAEVASGRSGTTLAVLLGAVAAVLLIVCSNVATMMVTRASSRAPEIAIRAALGVSSGRVARLVLVESLLLAAVGGTAGIVLASQLVRLASGSAVTGLPSLPDISMNPAVLVASVVTTIVVGLLFGLAPSLRLTRGDVGDLLRSSRGIASGDDRTRRVLIATQIALSAALLLGAALFLRSLWALQEQDPGFQAGDITTAAISLPDARYPEAADVQRFFDEVLQRLESAPGVVSAGAITMLPFTGGNDIYTTRTDLPADDPANGASPQFRQVTGNYLQALGIDLVGGRHFRDSDRADTPQVGLVDEQFARALFGEDNPIGEQIRIAFNPPKEVEIVGVARDILHFGLGSPLYGGGSLYLPTAQNAAWQLSLVIESRASDAAILRLREIVNELDPLLPLADVSALEDRVQSSIAEPRFRTLLVGGFAAAALLLAAIGLYGAMGTWVSDHQRDMGVRFALGADGSQILRMVLRRGLALVTIGLVAGVAIAALAGRVVASLLFGVGIVDPMSLLTVLTVLGAAGTIACVLPARRAARLNPIEVLRPD